MTTHTRTLPPLSFHLAISSIYIFCLVHHTCNRSFSTLSVEHSENTSSTPLSQYHMLAPVLSSSALCTASKLAIVFSCLHWTVRQGSQSQRKQPNGYLASTPCLNCEMRKECRPNKPLDTLFAEEGEPHQIPRHVLIGWVDVSH